MNTIRKATAEDVAYRSYVGSAIIKIKELAASGVDTLIQRRTIKSIIECLEAGDYTSADYLIQLLEEDFQQLQPHPLRGLVRTVEKQGSG